MIREVIWSPDSNEDMRRILDYLQSRWSKRVISRFLKKIDNSVNLIVEDPLIFPQIIEDTSIRKCFITKHKTLHYRYSASVKSS